jgi:hypothetical protein
MRVKVSEQHGAFPGLHTVRTSTKVNMKQSLLGGRLTDVICERNGVPLPGGYTGLYDTDFDNA